MARWAIVLGVLVAVGGSGVAPVWAQQAPGAPGPCARSQGLLTPDDREAIGRVILQRTKWIELRKGLGHRRMGGAPGLRS